MQRAAERANCAGTYAPGVGGVKPGHTAAMTEEHDRTEKEDTGGVGAEGGEGESAEKLPPLPAEGVDSPLGDTDQHSEATPGEHDQMKR